MCLLSFEQAVWQAFFFFFFNDMIAQLSNPIMKLFILYSEHFFFILICHFSWVERDAEEKYLENCSVRPHDAVSHEH